MKTHLEQMATSWRRSIARMALMVLLISAISEAQVVDPDFVTDGSFSNVSSFLPFSDGSVWVGALRETSYGLWKVSATGEVDPTFNVTSDGWVQSMIMQTDGKVIVAGGFAHVGGRTSSRIARLNQDGTADEGFNPPVFDRAVEALALQPDGKIVFASSLIPNGNVERFFVGRLNSDGSQDNDFADPEVSVVQTLAVAQDGKIYVGGNFATVAGVSRHCLARLNPTGTLDETFDVEVLGPSQSSVRSVRVLRSGAVLVGGYFTSVGGLNRRSMAKISADGEVDASFVADLGSHSETHPGIVFCLSAQADGGILIAGQFISVNGAARNHLARLTPEGTLDSAFVTGTDDYVFGTCPLPDGSMLLGGQFSSVAGTERINIAKLMPPAAATSTLSQSGFTQVNWTRGGSAPEIDSAEFLLWVNGLWQPLGSGTRAGGTWKLTGLTLPPSGRIKARGRVLTGIYNASSYLLDQEAEYSFGHPNAPTITVEPESLQVSLNSPALFTVQAQGAATLKYQWRLNGRAIAKATTPTYSLSSVKLAHLGVYDAVVTNAWGTALSKPAKLSQTAPITFSLLPQSVDVSVGDDPVFSVGAAGATSYQWFRDGRILAGETRATLLVPNADASKAGVYTVTVGGPSGKSTTPGVQLRVRDPKVLIYKVSGTGTAIQGVTTTTGAVSGYLIIDRERQSGGFLWTGKNGSLNTVSIDLPQNLYTHSTGPVPKSQSVITEVEAGDGAPNQDRAAVWLRGSDGLITFSANDKTIAPRTLAGSLQSLELGSDVRLQSVTLQCTLDVPHSTTARVNGETVGEALDRILQSLQKSGYALVH